MKSETEGDILISGRKRFQTGLSKINSPDVGRCNTVCLPWNSRSFIINIIVHAVKKKILGARRGVV